MTEMIYYDSDGNVVGKTLSDQWAEATQAQRKCFEQMEFGK